MQVVDGVENGTSAADLNVESLPLPIQPRHAYCWHPAIQIQQKTFRQIVAFRTEVE